ncbi:MAG TPA: hypothetical protein VGE29_08395 [Prosthecobacter sp.]
MPAWFSPSAPHAALFKRMAGLALSLALLLASEAGDCRGQEAAGTDPEQARALAGIPILPSRTDPEIKTFDFNHYMQVDRDIVIRQAKNKPAARQELLVWLTGTGGRGRGAGEFCTLAASLGYHVVKVMYPTDIPATICKRDADATSFETFRMSIIAGGTSPHITVSRADSIESRLTKLLQLLAKTRPREKWGQFLKADGTLEWEKLALAGQSQGGGHAFLMGMKHRVARVIGTGAPKDWSPKLPGPAPWLLAESATPKSRFFSFNHEQDRQGATPDQQWQILRAFSGQTSSTVVSVDRLAPPYQHSRHLSTNHPGGPLESSPAHTSVSANTSATIFKPVWTYLLTEPEAERSQP